MKTSSILILLCFCSTLVHAQITTATIRAGFGVDAELKSNYFNIPSSGTDDWFSDDTTGAAAWMNLHAADANMRRKTFVKNMSYREEHELSDLFGGER